MCHYLVKCVGHVRKEQCKRHKKPQHHLYHNIAHNVLIVTNIWKIHVSIEVFSEKIAEAFNAYEIQLHKTGSLLADIQLGVTH